VVSQSLTLLNDDFVVEQAAAMAARVARASDTADGRIQRAFQIALARAASEDEVQWASSLLNKQLERYQPSAMTPEASSQQAMAHLCQMLLNTNEFLYIP
jgi:hypothetical protein